MSALPAGAKAGTPASQAGVSVSSDYVIRRAKEIEEFGQLSDVYRRVFRTSERGMPPAWLMDDTAKVGGLTLGLWYRDEPVGFSFSFVGVENGEPYLFSDGLGVLPQHSAQGRAYEMKLAQREHALQLGYSRIMWTFSALRSVNAHLYTSRLGAVGVQYLPDKRGSLAGEWGTEGGVPFDEFLVDWRLTSERVTARLSGREHPPALDGVPLVLRCIGGSPETVAEQLDESSCGDRLALEVAPDYQALVDREPDSAHAWHEETQPVFAQLFERGYVLTECVRTGVDGRVLYLLERPARAPAGDEGSAPAGAGG